ncbi:hypothetical protein BEWA_029130 [Theileria equi strain WA]|uniref:U6 snRNA phosphodiesterase 1 n=1 Tax=Theileria equi strain WA TaxID=1537102 RepID=L0AXT3_THEEQ|nr:hypothetical protein BEWA_029130 [Theileria equi strain WA]AFZ80063.1 hypothetical protein BEWA_029130 [Theileria equi strain WA]|eukprot:XP_004829729.1 hypothetical protein BEWA_029130 [Theileria equi strain WA]
MAGRVRNLPHIDGNFHTLVYIKDQHLRKEENVQQLLRKNDEFSQPVDSDNTEDSFSDSDVNSGQNGGKFDHNYAHLSLCKPLYLRKQFIDPFLTKLKQQLSHIKPFYLMLDKRIAICANEAKNRFFAVLPVDGMCRDQSILPIIDIVDNVVESFGFQRYYTQRLPHVSVASTGDISHAMEKLYSEEGNRDDHSTHHWNNVEEYLGNCNATHCINLGIDEARAHVDYTFNMQESLADSIKEDLEDKIYIYVDEIHVLVGARDTLVKLAI